MNNKWIIPAVVVLILGGGFLWWRNSIKEIDQTLEKNSISVGQGAEQSNATEKESPKTYLAEPIADFRGYSSTTIETAGGNLVAYIADTPRKSQLGLGNRLSLPAGESMLFVFKEPDIPGFWMENMYFPITLLWVDENKKIIGIEKNMKPESYPKAFFPPDPIKYVIEMNVGEDEKLGLKVGDIVKFNI